MFHLAASHFASGKLSLAPFPRAHNCPSAMRSPLLPTFAVVFALLARAVAAPVEPGFAETTFITNASLGSPTGLAWAPDGSGRLFVTRKTGEVRIVQLNPATGTGTLVATPFATISPVFTNSECGVIGLCFDPDFLTNHYVYFFVTISASEQQIIRYTDTASIGGSKTTIVAGLPTLGNNHDGGGVGVGPDGKLYWSIGDNGNGTGVDADLTVLAAKVGRANRFTGAACNDNPFYDGALASPDTAARNRIWARGCRNPFTLTFQPGTGKLWLDVVGSSLNGDTIPNSGPGYEQVFVITRGAHVGWNDYENNQPAGYLQPLIAYRTNGVTTTSLAAVGAVRAGGVVTFTTLGFHPFRQGAKVTVAGVANTSFNGSFFVASRVSDTQFTIVQAGANATSGGGTAATTAFGGSVTGGCFYDSTAYPATHRGNFFFGDVNSNTVQRAVLDAGDVPVSVDAFITGNNQQVDIATGPDGALYYAQTNGSGIIRRLATTSAAQNLIVQPTAFQIGEGGSGVCTVRLAQAPVANVTVTVAKTSGDADVNVTAGASLTFTPANWNQFQTVTVSAAEDADRANDTAVFQVSSPGLTSYDVSVTAIDNEDPLLVLSAGTLAFTEGGTGSFTVRLASAPAGPVTVNVARTAGDSDITVSAGAALNFNAGNFSTPQTVTLAAAEDADTSTDTATISVTLGGDPTRTVAVSVADNDNAAPVFTSAPVLTAILGATYRYDADATGNPLPTYSLTTAPSGMTINNSTGVITWIPSATGTFAVAVRASNGIGTAPTQSFNVVVSTDAAPVASLTRPLPGDIVSGATAEFFGDGTDDVGCVKAEFFIDGVLSYTDINSGGHYHHGGTHVLWDTTPLTNGPHTLLLRVTDTIGQTGSAQVQVSVGNGGDAWRAQQFNLSDPADLAKSALSADAEGDGRINLFEYAFDTPPKTAGVTREPLQQTVNVAGTDYLALQFVMAKWALDLSFTVEATSDLTGLWTRIDPADPLYRVSAQDNVPSFGLMTVTVRDVLPKGAAPRFMRLEVTRP